MASDEIILRMASELSTMRDRLARLEAQETVRARATPEGSTTVKRNVHGIIRANDQYTDVFGTGTITIPNSTFTAVPWSTVRYQSNDSALWIAEYPTRIWAPMDGWMDLSAVVQMPVTTGTIGAAWRANGSTYVHEDVQAAGTIASTCAPTLSYPVKTGDYFELMILQNTGASKNLTITNYVAPECRAIYRTVNTNPSAGTQKYIMAVGDSKTVGGNGGYRICLQDIMLAANKRVGWVGAVDGLANGTSPAGMDGWHSAVSGATTSSIRTLVANAAINQAPDVILMWLGTNDLRAGTSEATIEAAYNGFLNDIFARWPSVTVCCANIDQNYEVGTPPLFNPATFNAFIAGLPAARGSQVKAVDMYTPLNFSTLHTDLLHPNHPAGSWLEAMTWWGTIKTLVG